VSASKLACCPKLARSSTFGRCPPSRSSSCLAAPRWLAAPRCLYTLSATRVRSNKRARSSTRVRGSAPDRWLAAPTTAAKRRITAPRRMIAPRWLKDSRCPTLARGFYSGLLPAGSQLDAGSQLHAGPNARRATSPRPDPHDWLPTPRPRQPLAGPQLLAGSQPARSSTSAPWLRGLQDLLLSGVYRGPHGPCRGLRL